MHSYEQWTRSEIARLRAEAEKALAEADTLQRAFDKWLSSQGIGPKGDESGQGANGRSVLRRGRRPGYGNKNAAALERIKAASPSGGLTTDELFDAFVEMFGQKYKRSSMRALLFHQKKLGNIENRNGRYVIASQQGAAQ